MLTALLKTKPQLVFISQQLNFPSSNTVHTAALLGILVGILPRGLAPGRVMMKAAMSLPFCNGRADLAELPKREVPRSSVVCI